MPALGVTEYSDYDRFVQEWHGDETPDADDTEARLVWQLLGRLDEDELLIQIPEWLAEEKTGFVDGKTPTEFVGRIDRESEKAIHVADSATATQLTSLAHRIEKLEDGLEKAAGDDSRHEWLEDRLREKRQAFEERREVPGLAEEWIPASQIQRAVRRVE